MNGLTYFRFKSPYSGDMTKNCALTGGEVDNNFYVLEGRDIQSVTVKDNDLVITLTNGSEVRAKDFVNSSNIVSNIDFDPIRGVLRITKNGKIEEIGGFNTKGNVGNGVVAVDGTMIGNGSPAYPVGISPIAKTGQYAPVDEIVDIDRNDRLPKPEKIKPGYRVLTREAISDYGFLYDYEGVKRIACELRDQHTGWRIPSKEDWDDMLDGVEPCKADKNHSSAVNNHYLGKWAGKLLKSTDKWKEVEHYCDDDEHEHHHCHDTHAPHHHHDEETCFNFGEEEVETMCEVRHPEDNHCHPVHIGHPGHEHHKLPMFSDGLNEFGFSVTPAGYADDGENYMYFGERAYFWTATNSKYTSAYVKRFDYDKASVHQDIMAAQNHLSLRLIKTFDGSNYSEREEILGNDYNTVLMPSAKHGHAIWTSSNFANGARVFGGLMPNDGQNLTVSHSFFINEWDGRRWHRSRMTEGETVVVKHAPHDKVNEEYIIKDGKLISVPNAIRHDVFHAVKHDIDQLHKHFHDKLTAVDEKFTSITNEITEHITQSDTTANEFKVEYDAFVAETNDKFEEVAQRFEDEANNRVNADNDLSNRIDAETVARTEGDEKLECEIVETNEHLNIVEEFLNKEIGDREDADTTLQENIDTVATNLEQLSNRVDNLNGTHDSDKDEIVGLIEQETADRNAKDEEIIAQLADETAARIAEDEAINEHLNSVEGDLLIQTDSNFDTENGILTLKSNDGSNDITIQFRANFGEF